MTAGDWAAISVAIAGLIVALAGLPPTPYRRSVITVSVLLVSVAIVIGVLNNTAFSGPESNHPGSSSATSTGGSTSNTTTPPPLLQSQPVATISLGANSGKQATLYFGQLAQVVHMLDRRVTFAIDQGFLAEHSTLCVDTVVFDGVSGSSGVVFAQQLGSGWTGAENAPNTQVEPPTDTVHQQLIVPPASAMPGDIWTGSALLQQNGSTAAISGNYMLKLLSSSESLEQWEIRPNGNRVSCESS